MPDLSTLYPQTPALEGWSAGQVQGQQYLDAQQNQQINQAGALQDLWKKQQMAPLDIENKRLSNKGLVQDNRHKTTTADKAKYDFDWQKRFENEEYTKKMNEYARLVDADKIAAAKQRISLGLMTAKTPQEQRQYQQALEMTDDIQKELMKIKAHGDQQVRVANVQQAGMNAREDKKAAAKAANLKVGFEAEMANTKGRPRDQYAVVTRYLSQTEPGTPEYMQLLKTQQELYPLAAKDMERPAPSMIIDPSGAVVPNPARPQPLPAPSSGATQWEPPDGWK